MHFLNANFKDFILSLLLYMRCKSKIRNKETFSPVLSAKTSRKLHNRSLELSDNGKLYTKYIIKHLNFFPQLINIENSLGKNPLVHSLKESLTVKKIEFSHPRCTPTTNVSTTPYKNRATPQQLLGKVDSFRSLSKHKFRSKNLNCSNKIQAFSKLKKPEKALKNDKFDKQGSPDKGESVQMTPKKNFQIRREYAAKTPSYTTPTIRIVKPLPAIQFREAMRNPNWVTKARPELDKMWRRIIAKSNGIEPVNSSKGVYTYYIGKGNNSRLIDRILSSRNWWVEVDNMDEANFVWTQWKDKQYMQKLPVSTSQEAKKIDTFPVSLLSPVSILVDKNQYRAVEIDELGFQYIRNSSSYTILEAKSVDSSNFIMYNKIEFNQHLANKKGLFKSMKNYYIATSKNVFEYMPLTFHIKYGEEDPEFIRFVNEYQGIEIEKSKTRSQNLWIIKPGENSNRGQGIHLGSTLSQIKELISEKIDPETLKPHTYIVQKYIEKPFLLHKRKFDIRCYAVITSINGVIQGYSYTDGYLRTASTEYSTKDITNSFIHLTNDAIQKHSEEYGKFEDGNKLSYRDFQRYLDFHYSEKKTNFINDVIPIMKNLIRDSIQSVFFKIDPKRRLNCMEIFGYDFMLDCNLKPWLIEVNTNPCLELASGYLTMLIPAMVENAFRIAVDPLFPPPVGKHSFEAFFENKFELIFHQEINGKKLIEDVGEKKDMLIDNEELSDDEDQFASEN